MPPPDIQHDACPAIGSYDFLAPPRICFGWGRRSEVGRLAASLGSRALIVSGSRTLQSQGVLDEISASLRAAGVEPVPLASISREPEVADVDAAVTKLTSTSLAGTLVLAIGGGSALDLGKAIAAMATQQPTASVLDYLEGVGRGLTLKQSPLPVLAMPTTAGTGSEATKNAVISSYEPPFKKSLRSDAMVPRVVLIDPELTVSVPPSVTAHTGMDAITQLIESYISCRAKPIPSALCLHGLTVALPAMEIAFRDGQHRPAREALAHAALLSGMALANSGLGLAHGVAAALGVQCRVAHGLACAVMLPVALCANREVSQARLAELARAALGIRMTDEAATDALIERIDALCAALGIPRRLSDLGVTAADLPGLVAGSRGNSLSGNPREISPAELHDLLEAML